MVLALQIFVYEVGQELFEDISSVLQLALQHCHDQRGHIATVPHGEAALGLQRADEGQQENLVVDELCKELEAFLHPFLPVARDLYEKTRSLYLSLTAHCQAMPKWVVHPLILLCPQPSISSNHTLQHQAEGRSKAGKRKSCLKRQRQFKIKKYIFFYLKGR